jgi:DNA-binding response OmpR family regulator
MKILIVEDEPSASTMLARIVANAGHHPTIAADAEAAWALLDDPCRSFDVVFLDLVLPKMSGVELWQRIRASALLQSVEVVFCTASNDRATVLKIVQNGARHYIVKPISPEKIIAKLNQLRPSEPVSVERTLAGV